MQVDLSFPNIVQEREFFCFTSFLRHGDFTLTNSTFLGGICIPLFYSREVVASVFSSLTYPSTCLIYFFACQCCCCVAVEILKWVFARTIDWIGVLTIFCLKPSYSFFSFLLFSVLVSVSSASLREIQVHCTHKNSKSHITCWWQSSIKLGWWCFFHLSFFSLYEISQLLRSMVARKRGRHSETSFGMEHCWLADW